ncbi:SPOR domain-containing protein [Sphingobium terrigena]|uniref:SPOR domain-containing protein n=1 Tax=Sphingobium terrigena TaxID=2304063 RepID=A0A418YWJ0_9SPHN|nr:SPOR domain-containing protein [Sphingobium terrigena]RJG56775.1 SPOR domain-containing protein [Sphingobium terrigena]
MLSGGARAQVDQSQLVRPPDAADLNTYLARLSANPRDVAALIGAGEAALALDDPRAAAGFFARADAIASGNGRIKAGLGRVMLKLQNPGEALRLFDQAARLGYPDATILADRGLARDMTGDQAGAQRDYQAALQRTPDDAELIRRYAASLGIAGQVEAADKVMQPLFYKSDRAAWRYRAFILAMNNRQADAQKIAEQTMPAQLATAIIPYMRKMPYLTPAQKAAAVHFGHFPTQIGTSIAAIVPTPPAPGYSQPVVAKTPPVVVAAAPTSPAQDRRARRAEQQRQRREATRLARAETVRPAVVQPAAAPTPTPTPIPIPIPAPPSVAQQPAPQPVQPPPAQVQMVQPTPAAPAPVQTAPPQQVAAASPQVQGPPAPGFESVDTAQTAAPAASQPAPATQLNAITLAQASVPAPSPSMGPPSPVVQPTPMPAVAPSPPQPDPQATRTLADIIRAIDVPETERQSSVAAVDLAEIEKIQAARRAERLAAADKVKKAAAAKAKAEADAKAKKEAEEKKRLADNPARSWLQIATGASKSALGFTLKTMRKKYDALAPQSAWVASWGRTNRLVVGPFASFTRAKTLETKLKGEGADVFAWQSDAGEVVERLGGE